MKRNILNTGAQKGCGRASRNAAGHSLSRLSVPFLALSLCGGVTAGGVGMSNSWIDLSISKSRCIQQATLAVKRAGFTENFEVAGESVFADQADYSVLFRCVPSNRLAYVVVAGPDSDLADQYVSDVQNGFSGR
jgi:hypothetical protein